MEAIVNRATDLMLIPTGEWTQNCVVNTLMQMILFILIFYMQSASSQAFGFDTFEHRYIGTEAYNHAWHSVSANIPKSKKDWLGAIASLNMDPNGEEAFSHEQSDALPLPMEFGDLTALAGDFTDTPKEMMASLLTQSPGFKPGYMPSFWPVPPTETQKEMVNNLVYTGLPRFQAIKRQWTNACVWVKKRGAAGFHPPALEPTLHSCLRDAMRDFDDELVQVMSTREIVADPITPAKGYEPLRAELASMERIKGFVGLASNNKKHFPKESWNEYKKNHLEALVKANRYAAKSQEDTSRREDLRQAIVYEAFAQHYLQDSFSGGHLGVDADELISWNFKELLLHTHDTLNRIGVPTHLKKSSPDFFEDMPSSIRTSFLEKSIRGWVAYGDRHLMTPEATFQRLLIIQLASFSIKEVMKAAEKVDYEPRMWNDDFFPRPRISRLGKTEDKEKEKEKKVEEPGDAYPITYDKRVPPLLTEGWYVFMGPGTLLGPTNVPGTSFFNRGSASGYTVDLGLVRPTEPLWPNYFGLGFSQAPGVRTSIYPLSIGYWFPNQIMTDSGGIYWGYRLNLGARLDEKGTFENSSSGEKVKMEVGLVFDAGMQLFKPISVFVRLELLSTSIGGSVFTDPKVVSDSIFGNGAGFVTLGLRYQLVGVQ